MFALLYLDSKYWKVLPLDVDLRRGLLPYARRAHEVVAGREILLAKVSISYQPIDASIGQDATAPAATMVPIQSVRTDT